MKTKMKKSLLVALMLGTLIGYANDNTNPTEFVGKKTVKVEFKDVKKGQTLTINNENGVTIYTREIQSNGTFSKLFDLSALEDGNYSAELNKDFEIIIRTFNVKDGKITFLNEENKKIFKPVIRPEGNLLYVSKIAFNHKPVKVTIYFNNDLVSSETLKSEDLLKRIYKLSEKGYYKVIVNSDKRTYSKDFTI